MRSDTARRGNWHILTLPGSYQGGDNEGGDAASHDAADGVTNASAGATNASAGALGATSCAGSADTVAGAGLATAAGVARVAVACSFSDAVGARDPRAAGVV